MSLYHSDIYIPHGLYNRIPKHGIIKLSHSQHAMTQAESKDIVLPETVDFSKVSIFEIEYDGRIIRKLVYRISYNRKYDLIVAINNAAMIITVWLNHKTDNHATIDYSKYDIR